MSKDFGFLQHDRKENNTVPPKERMKSWNEFHTPLDVEARRQQASRCMHCGVPYCQSALMLKGMTTGCPLNNLIPEWNEELFHENDQYALVRLLKTNPFPEFTSRVCPALCEKACLNGVDSQATTIHDNEYYIIENGYEKGWMEPVIPQERTGNKVAVIGSGPAGLTVAQLLNQRGHSVTVYERDDQPGGLLMYGIPNMKLDKSVMDRRIEKMKAEGVEFICGVEAGSDITKAELQENYDAVVLACGSRKARSLPLMEQHPDNAVFAVDYLTKATKALRSGRPSSVSAKRKNVVIVGGGDTGNDCVATALRQGARSVVQLEMMPEPPEERAADNPWPEWPKVKKTDYGQEEAIYKFHKDPRIFSSTIKEAVIEDGQIKKLIVTKLENMKPVEGSEFELDCDLLLIAAGFNGIEDSLKEAFQLPVTPRNAIAVKPGTKTVEDGLFACGDCARGQSLVVWALAEGKACAQDVDAYLMGYTNIE